MRRGGGLIRDAGVVQAGRGDCRKLAAPSTSTSSTSTSPTERHRLAGETRSALRTNQPLVPAEDRNNLRWIMKLFCFLFFFPHNLSLRKWFLHLRCSSSSLSGSSSRTTYTLASCWIQNRFLPILILLNVILSTWDKNRAQRPTLRV